MHSAEREQCGSRFPPSRFPGWDDGLGDGDAPPSSSVRRRLHPGFLWPPLGPFHCPLGRARRWRQLRLLRPTNLLRLLVLRCRIVMTLRATVGRSILLASGNAGGGWPCCCCSKMFVVCITITVANYRSTFSSEGLPPDDPLIIAWIAAICFLSSSSSSSSTKYHNHKALPNTTQKIEQFDYTPRRKLLFTITRTILHGCRPFDSDHDEFFNTSPLNYVPS